MSLLEATLSQTEKEKASEHSLLTSQLAEARASCQEWQTQAEEGRRQCESRAKEQVCVGVGVCVCMWVGMSACVCVWVWVCVCVSACVWVWVCVCVSACGWVWVWVGASTLDDNTLVKC